MIKTLRLVFLKLKHDLKWKEAKRIADSDTFVEVKFISAHSIPPFKDSANRPLVPKNFPIVGCRNFMNELGEQARTLEECSNDMAYRDSDASWKHYRRLGGIFDGPDEKSKKIVEIFNEIFELHKTKHKEIWQTFEADIHMYRDNKFPLIYGELKEAKKKLFPGVSKPKHFNRPRNDSENAATSNSHERTSGTK